MPKRRGGGYRAPKDYQPRGASGRGGGAAARFRGRPGERADAGGDDRRAATHARGGSAPSRGDRSQPRRDDVVYAPLTPTTPAPVDDMAPAPKTPTTPAPTSASNPAPTNPTTPAPENSTTDTPTRASVTSRTDPDGERAAARPAASFAELGLGLRIVESLAALGATAPFPIQAATIPDAIAGRDVLGRGSTGSGKTIAFGAALVERLLVTKPLAERGAKRVEGRPPRALVIAPTRELALQIDRTIQPIARSVGMFTTQVYGGVPQQRQVGGLKRGVDIVIGTPGRIEDLQRQGHLDLSRVEITVLDEADQMCDLGFLEATQRILRRVQRGGQRMLFSATLDAQVQQLVDEFLTDPALHETEGGAAHHGDLEHRVLVVERRDRDAVLRQLAGSGGRVLVFTRTRLEAERIAADLSAARIPTVALHGDLTQARRTQNLDDLTSRRVDVLVATDVAARGIHLDDVRLVVQADAPDEYKTYLHRSGRTGRAGASGTVVTLIPPARRHRMARLLERAGIEAPMITAAPGGPELDAFDGTSTR